MRRCNKCEHEFADEFTFCPHCGEAYVDEQQATQKADVSETSSVMARLAQHERKNHFIKNAVIFVMSLIMLICSLFAGGNVELAQDEGTIPVPQTIVQMAEGLLIYLDGNSSSKEQEIFVEYGKAYMQAFQSTLEELGSQGEIFYSSKAEYDAFVTLFGKNLSKTGYNICVYNAYVNKMVLGSSYDPYYYPWSANDVYGAVITVAVIVVQLCLIVTTLVFSIKSLIALIKHQGMSNPFKMATLPFTFILIRLVLFVIHPSALIDDAGIALVVVGALLILMLGAHKAVLENSSRPINVLLHAKQLTQLAIGCIAFFVACGAIYLWTNVTTTFDSNFTYPITGNDILFEGILANRVVNNAPPSSQNTIKYLINVAIAIFYVILMSVGASFLSYIFRFVAGDEAILIKDNPLKKIKKRVITMIVFLVLIIAMTFLLSGAMSDFSGATEDGMTNDVEVKLSVNIVISLVMCVALLVVDAAWKITPKQPTNEPASITA